MTTFARPNVSGQAMTLPRHYFTSEAVFAQEMQRIFTQQWLFVGRAEQVATPGEYMLVEIGTENLIVVRDQQHQIRAFYNVCRHRGTRMCTEPAGRFANSIQCPYHAWTYGLDGSLLAARHMQDVESFDKADWPLLAAHVAEWRGFLFLNLASAPEPFEQAFAPLLNKFGDWNIENLRVARAIEYDVQANWKLVVENYSECYHCPLIHPALTRLSDPQSGRNDLLEGPFLGGFMTLEEGEASMTTSGHTSRPPVGTVRGDDLQRVYYYSIMPNMLLSLHPDYVMAHRLMPLAPGRVKIICEWLFDPATMQRPDFDPSDAVEFWDMTNRQDWHVCELSQLGIQSQAYVPGLYAHAEGLLYAFDQYYLEMLEG
ncbi:MAG: aromatic ring-hydroxylating dioxygenase subunit alpha [Chloroflexaceae bacterium]|nr:aromatic ring-hydroxylating dioxygenase subunit alpha [Chloroflexaceae bacterium]NJO06397.1 aromatic ring-hydroxylating dioxygenase subunit alpha [Chloroflexaceae bacterium]